MATQDIQAPAEDCPICYGELGNPPPLCPNGHKVCDICRPHLFRDLTRHGARCPICRHALPLEGDAGRVDALAREHARRRRGGGGGGVGGGMDPELVELWRGVAEDIRFAETAHRLAEEQRALRNAHPQPARGGHGGGGRPHRGPAWDEAREQFLAHREAGRIPAHSVFGGIHQRKCGHPNCQRAGGSQGVRFLLFGGTGKRRYRCEEHTEG